MLKTVSAGRAPSLSRPRGEYCARFYFHVEVRLLNIKRYCTQYADVGGTSVYRYYLLRNSVNTEAYLLKITFRNHSSGVFRPEGPNLIRTTYQICEISVTKPY